jgi:pyruvate kinase
MSRRAKIVCTLGPATGTQENITALVEAGMDVARLNFSHGGYADHEKWYGMVREASDRTGHAVAVLADLQGPKIRLGTFADGPVQWVTGSQVCITVEDVEGTAQRVSTTYKGRPTSGSATGCWSTTASWRCPSSGSRAPTCSAWSSRAARSPTTRASRCPAWR